MQVRMFSGPYSQEIPQEGWHAISPVPACALWTTGSREALARSPDISTSTHQL